MAEAKEETTKREEEKEEKEWKFPSKWVGKRKTFLKRLAFPVPTEHNSISVKNLIRWPPTIREA